MKKEELLTYGIMLALCILIGLICFCGKRKNWFLSFCLQGLLSVAVFILVNQVIKVPAWTIYKIPITPFNLGICFILGFCGMIMLYGITYMSCM